MYHDSIISRLLHTVGGDFSFFLTCSEVEINPTLESSSASSLVIKSSQFINVVDEFEILNHFERRSKNIKTWLSSSIPSDLFYIPGSALPKFGFGLVSG